MNRKDYEEAITDLNEIRNYDKDKWGIFFLGTQVILGQTRIYVHEGTARARVRGVLEMCYYDEKKKNKEKLRVQELVNELEKSGMLEIRKLGDRSPKFPHNAFDKEQADKFSKMLDASDSEMVNLAISVIESAKNQKNELQAQLC